MNRSYMKKIIVCVCVCFVVWGGIAHAVIAPNDLETEVRDVISPVRVDAIDREVVPVYVYPKQFVWGDCSWVDQVALAAGWEQKHLATVKIIAARESGCCPNRAGGDKVDKFCNITGVSEWSHRSDSGLMQLNGVHWLRSHKNYAGLFCKRYNICEQEPLLDAFTNLRMAKALFDVVGWSAWQKQS